MVDKDKVKEKLGGSDSPPVTDTDDSGEVREKVKTKEQKLDQLKGKSPSRSSGTGTEDIKRLLFCLAAMDAFVRVVKEYEFDTNKANVKLKEDIASDIAGEITHYMGVYDVEKVADDYGYSYGQILQVLRDNQDIEGKTMETNPGEVEHTDVESLCKAVSSILLHTEGVMRDKKDKASPSRREEIAGKINGALYDYYSDLISDIGVQRIAEKHGYDWREDIVEEVVANIAARGT